MAFSKIQAFALLVLALTVSCMAAEVAVGEGRSAGSVRRTLRGESEVAVAEQALQSFTMLGYGHDEHTRGRQLVVVDTTKCIRGPTAVTLVPNYPANKPGRATFSTIFKNYFNAALQILTSQNKLVTVFYSVPKQFNNYAITTCQGYEFPNRLTLYCNFCPVIGETA